MDTLLSIFLSKYHSFSGICQGHRHIPLNGLLIEVYFFQASPRLAKLETRKHYLHLQCTCHFPDSQLVTTTDNDSTFLAFKSWQREV